MNLTDWQTKVREQLQSSAPWLRKATPGMAYGALATYTLLPLVMAHQQFDGAATQAIAQIFSGIGLNLFSQQLAAWFGKNDEELATLLGEKAEEDTAWRDAFDELLKQVETPKLAQAVLSEADWDRLARLLKEDVERLGSKIELHIGGDVAGDVVVADGINAEMAAIGTGITQIKTERYVAKEEHHHYAPANSSAPRSNHYFHRLRTHCHAIPLTAMGGEATAGDEVTLDQLYIALDTTTTVPLTAAEKAARKKANPQRNISDEEKRIVTALEAT